ncbi:MAG: RNA polymerase sigma factor [Bradymonadia bacterium]
MIKKALGGHSGALRMLARRILPVIKARALAYTRRRGGDLGVHDADDLVQEIWLTLLSDDGRLLKTYDATRGKSLEGYVGLICRRELWRRARAHGAIRRGGEAQIAPLEAAAEAPTSAPDPEAIVMGQNLLDGLSSYLSEQLPERGRLVLSAIYEDHLEPAKAAQMMGVKVQVVYNWQHKIRGLIKAYCAEAGVAV